MDTTIRHQAKELIGTAKILRKRLFLLGSDSETNGNGNGFSVANFTEAQLGTMMVLGESEEISLKELAECLGVSSPSASAMVERLVESGVVFREPGLSDRRAIRLGLTPKGRKAVDAYEARWLMAAVDLLDKMGPVWAERWCAVYDKLQEVMDEERLDSRAPGLDGGEMQ